MIIDAHQHLVSGPQLGQYQAGLLNGRGFHGKGNPNITRETVAGWKMQGKTHIELLDEVGLGLHDLEGDGYRFVVSRIATRFLVPAIAGDALVIETEVLELRRASSRWGQRLLRGDEVLATQEVVAAVTGTNGRPTRFSADMASCLAPYLVSDGDTGA